MEAAVEDDGNTVEGEDDGVEDVELVVDVVGNGVDVVTELEVVLAEFVVLDVVVASIFVVVVDEAVVGTVRKSITFQMGECLYFSLSH